MLGGEHRSIIRCPTLVEHFYPRVPNLNVVVASAELLKADMTLARSVLDGRSGGAIVAFHDLLLFGQVQVLDNL
jgi:hypothetical protein